MSVLLFRLNNVPDDEAQNVRELLSKNDIDYYETSAGNWGLSTAAIWLKDAAHLKRARSLIEEYQKQRTAEMRDEYARLKKEGKAETVLDRIKEHPIRFLLFIAIIVLILYGSTKPFLDFGR